MGRPPKSHKTTPAKQASPDNNENNTNLASENGNQHPHSQTIWGLCQNTYSVNVMRVLQSVVNQEAVAMLKEMSCDNVTTFASDDDFLMSIACRISLYHGVQFLTGSFNIGQIANDMIRHGSVLPSDGVDALNTMIEALDDYMLARAMANDGTAYVPRILRTVRLLDLTAEEANAFFYLVAVNAVPWLVTPIIRLTGASIAKYARMSPLQYMTFMSEDRAHFRQGLLAASEARGKANMREREMRVQNEAVAALCGVHLSEAELLRLEKSAVAQVLEEDGIVFGMSHEHKKKAAKQHDSDSSSSEDDDASTDEDEKVAEEEKAKRVKRDRDGNNMVGTPTTASANTEISPVPTATVVVSIDQQPYTSEVDYLDDMFKYIATLIRLRTLESDMKDEDAETLVLSSRQKTESQLREMQGRERLLKLRCDRRLEASVGAGFVPKAEALAKTHSMSRFEKLTVLLLVGNSISHDILIAANGKYVMRGEAQRECTVGYILFVLCDGLKTRVMHRECFQRTSTLVREGFIAVSGPSSGAASSACDLSDCLVDIDRKLVDHITGLTTSFADIVDGSSLYQPTVDLDQVVLPSEALEKVQRTVSHYDQYMECRTRIGFNEMGRQGLVMMFCGPSGTGKTMLTNAIAARMKKKILLVNVVQYQQSARSSLSSNDLFKFVFREARLQNAIVFFDECEAFFEGGSGTNPLVLSLLVELERYSGLVILATNNPQNIHEAMHRRITLCIEFQLPNYVLRDRIWKGHIPPKLRISANVDFPALALNFELSGGLIKNAVLSAIALAVARDETSDPEVQMEDFIEGAKLQLRGAYSAAVSGSDDLKHMVPKRNLTNLCLDNALSSQLWDIVKLIKSKNTLLSSWGFHHEEHVDQLCGFVALFYGPAGCGKSTAAEGIALECGVTMRVANLAELILKHNQVSNQIESLFTEARKQNAIVVLDNAERLLDHSDAASELSQLLQYYAARYPRPIFVMIRTDRAEVDVTSTNLHFTAQVRFPIPSREVRRELWKTSFPKGVQLSSDINYDTLSRENVSGGMIRNVCFMACAHCAASLADTDRVITMAKLQKELDKATRLAQQRTPYRQLFV